MNPDLPSSASRVAPSRPLSEAAESGVEAAAGLLESGREKASQALGTTAERLRELRYGMSDTASAAQRRVERAADAASDYIARRPLRATVMAAAAGAVLMALTMASRRQRHHH